MIRASLPVKPYIKKYLNNCFGDPAHLRRDSAIGKYFYQLVDDPRETDDKKYAGYSDTVIVEIPEFVFLHKGCVLTRTNITSFNNFVEDYLKVQIRTMIDVLVEVNGIKMQEAIWFVWDKFNMDEHIMPLETIKKDYYRYRLRSEALVLKNKNIYVESVPKIIG